MTNQRPNLIYVFADQLRYQSCGFAGDEKAITPNIDRLAAESVNFINATSSHPMCAPYRASLMTGCYPKRVGLHENESGAWVLFPGNHRGLHPREVTVAEVLRNAGYATGLVGKWHNGTFDARYEPNARGYDEFVGFCGGWVDYYKYRLRRNGSFQDSDGTYMTDLLTAEALGFLDRYKDQPFFLTLAYSAPHSPFQAPRERIDPYLEKGFNRIVATTYAMIELMDEGIGRVLDKLDATGLAQDTIVLFTSDNGPAFFNPPYMLEPGEDTYNERFNAGFRGSKGWIQEGGIRVPMLARAPGLFDGGRMVNDLAHFTDWLPTLLALTGVQPPEGPAMDGHDLSPLLRGEAFQRPPRQFWQWNFYMPDIGNNAAMRDGDWKLVRPMISGSRFFRPELCVGPEDEARTKAFVEADIRHKADPASVTGTLPVPRLKKLEPEPLELYNLAEDPGEANDLAAREPDRVHRMQTALENWFEDVERERATISD